jgi:hypothetical protein
MAGFHNGKGYYNPIDFCKAVMAFEAAHVEAAQETPETAPATLAPTHSVPEVDTVAVPKEAPVVKPETVVASPATPAKATLPTLKVGSKGGAVKKVQAKVGATADGVFGPNTKKAVMAFQTKHGLPATGVVDAATWAKIG